MSVETVTYVLVTCDACGRTANSSGTNTYEARKAVRDEGWKFERKWDRDLCETCKFTEGIVPDQRSKP